MTLIPFGKQHVTEDDRAAVAKALQPYYLTQGPTVKLFEDAFASYVVANYAVDISNGTPRLHVSYLSLGLANQSNVIDTPILFSASANSIRNPRRNGFFASLVIFFFYAGFYITI